jgi:hypothetical protein
MKEKYKATIGLSHDVDIPDKHHRTTLRSNLHYLKDANRNDYWRFDDIMDMEKSLGVRSTFYFCTHNRYSILGDPKDVTYSIKTRKFKNIIRKLSSNGFSIGLHAGINQYRCPDSFIESQNIFQSILGHKVLGIRHHWWNVGPRPYNTFECHYNAGFRYDTSICSEEITGFQEGILTPYYIGRTMEIPTFLEDSHIMYYKNTTFKDVKMWIKKLIDCNGVGCIDWHVRTSSPFSREYKEWGEMYEKIVKYLADNGEVEVTDIDSIYTRGKYNIFEKGGR